MGMSKEKLFLLLSTLLALGILTAGFLIRTQQISRSEEISSNPSAPRETAANPEDAAAKRSLVVGRSANDDLPQLNLQTIFSRQGQTLPANLDPQKLTSVLVTGDVLTARTVNAKNRRFNDFTWPFLKTADLTRAADITFINLETPLIPDCPSREDGMIFCGDPRNLEGLLFAGVDVINFANNHAGNQELAGVEGTVRLLEEAGLAVSGVKGPVYKKIRDTTFAFLGYNEVDQQVGVARAEDNLIRTEVAQARESADVVIVTFHWGQEYTYQPTENQKRLARLTVDAGADLIVGNHAHWFQAVEFYKDTLISYGHGNFVFDQMWSQETREGLVGKYTFYEDQLVDTQFVPILIEDYGQPRIMNEAERSVILQRLETESQKLANPAVLGQ